MTNPIIPVNRHIMVEKQVEEKDSFSSAFAEELKTLNQYLVVKVLKASPDCQKIQDLKEGDKVVVPANMIVEFEIDGSSYSMVQENYVLAISK